MKKLLILSFLLGHLFAQQEPIYNFFYKNLSLVSPSFAGQTSSIDFLTLYRKKWAGFPDSPQSVVVLSNLNLGNFNYNIPFGVGLQYEFDQLGGFRANNLTIPLSYYFNFIPKTAGRLLVGIGFKLQHTYLQRDWVYMDGGDANIPPSILTGFLPFNFDLGVSYIFRDAYLFSFSVKNALNTKNQLRQELINRFDPKQREYVFYVGQILSMDKKNKLESNHLLRIHNIVQFNTTQFDWNLSADYLINQIVFLGFSYRYLGTSGVKIGVEKDFSIQTTHLKWAVGYSNEYSWNNFTTNSFSHEIFTSFNVLLERKNGKKRQEDQNVNNSRYYKNTL